MCIEIVLGTLAFYKRDGNFLSVEWCLIKSLSAGSGCLTEIPKYHGEMSSSVVIR